MPRRLGPTAAVFLASALAALAAPAGTGAAPPGPAHLAGLRRTAELRRERRRERGALPVGAIVPYPLPPVLVIRQTPAAHDEVETLLDMLRR